MFASPGLHWVAENCRTAVAMTAMGGGEIPSSSVGVVFDVCGMRVPSPASIDDETRSLKIASETAVNTWNCDWSR